MTRKGETDLPPVLARTADHLRRAKERAAALRASLQQQLSPAEPLVLEIGCGHGHFLTAYAAAHPGQHCVGIDIVRDRIERASRKRNRARLPNLSFLLAEANEFLTALPPAVHLGAVFVLFPDPWPKRRHHKNRLIQSGFLKAIAERSGPETRIYFRTDFEPYFIEAERVIRTDAQWCSVDEAWPFEMETVFQARAPRYFSLIAKKRGQTEA